MHLPTDTVPAHTITCHMDHIPYGPVHAEATALARRWNYIMQIVIGSIFGVQPRLKSANHKSIAINAQRKTRAALAARVTHKNAFA